MEYDGFAPVDEYRTYYRVIVDGEVWEDADGQTEWILEDAESIADHVASLGYADIDLEPVG